MSGDASGRLRYFWWPEFQKRGALHYHAILIDPPFELVREARAWFDAHWTTADGAPLAGIQTWVDWKAFAWFRKSGGAYILKDVRKLSGKVYEQDYTHMPKGWRTCSSNRLEFELAEHQEHESKAHTACAAAPGDPYHVKLYETYVWRVDEHVPALGGCRLTRRRDNGLALRRLAPYGARSTQSPLPAGRLRPRPAGLGPQHVVPARSAYGTG